MHTYNLTRIFSRKNAEDITTIIIMPFTLLQTALFVCLYGTMNSITAATRILVWMMGVCGVDDKAMCFCQNEAGSWQKNPLDAVARC